MPLYVIMLDAGCECFGHSQVIGPYNTRDEAQQVMDDHFPIEEKCVVVRIKSIAEVTAEEVDFNNDPTDYDSEDSDVQIMPGELVVAEE